MVGARLVKHVCYHEACSCCCPVRVPVPSPSVCHTASWLLCWLVQTGVLLVTWSHGWVVEERWSVVEQIEQRAAAGSAVVSAQHT